VRYPQRGARRAVGRAGEGDQPRHLGLPLSHPSPRRVGTRHVRDGDGAGSAKGRRGIKPPAGDHGNPGSSTSDPAFSMTSPPGRFGRCPEIQPPISTSSYVIVSKKPRDSGDTSPQRTGPSASSTSWHQYSSALARVSATD